MVKKKKKKTPGISNKTRAEEFAVNFEFNETDDPFDNWRFDLSQYAKKKAHSTSLDEKIAKLRRQRKKEGRDEDGEAEVPDNGSDIEGEEDDVESSEDESDQKRGNQEVSQLLFYCC